MRHLALTSSIVRGALLCVLHIHAPMEAHAAVPAPSAPEFQKAHTNTGAGGLVQPGGVVFLPAGGFVVVERGLQRAVVLDSNGQFVRAIGNGFGSDPGQFGDPTCVAATASGDILIVDTGHSRVQRFSSTGTFLQLIGGPGSGQGELEHPIGIAVAPSGDIYVVDQWHQRIVRYSASGAFLLAWGSPGTGPGEFNYPSHIAVDRRGHVYVTDLYNARVQKFSPSGAFLLSWGTPGGGPGQFTSPVGITVDELGSVYVADVGAKRLQHFSDHGEWRATFSGPGAGPGQVQLPMQLASAAPGVLLVADELNHRVLRFLPKIFPPGNEPIGIQTGLWELAAIAPPVFLNGVAAGENGEAFVIDSEHKVRHLGSQGQVLATWSSRQAGVTSYAGSASLDYDAGKVFVVDNSAIGTQELDRVLVFSPSGTLLSSFGGIGNHHGGLNDPSQLRVDASGVVNVLSLIGNGGARVDRFTADGTFLSRIPVPLANGLAALEPEGIWTTGGSTIKRYETDGTISKQVAVGPLTGHLGFGAAHRTADRGTYMLDPAVNAIRRFADDGSLLGSLVFPVLPTGLSPLPWDVDGSPSGELFISDEGQAAVRRYSTPAIPVSIVDQPADDGGVLTLRFLRSSTDVPGAPLHAIGYQILRKLDGELPPDPHPIPGLPDWEMVTTVTGTGAAEYTVSVPTSTDATPDARMLSTFIVRTLTTPFFVIDSAPITGYSYDDLPPPPPSALVGQLGAEGTTLTWPRSTDDAATYRLYRGDSEGFELHDGALIASGPDTSHFDAGASGRFYAVTAVDPASNESAAVRLGPGGTLDVPSVAATVRFALRRSIPNPTRGDQLTLELALPSAEPARVQVFDVSGRIVAEREVGSLGAGEHRLEWRLARPLSPGLYLVRLTSAGHSQLLRLAVIR